MTATDTSAEAQVPVLLGIRELVAIFPDVSEDTIYRWRSASGGRRVQLPVPYRTISGTPMWTEDQILTFADGKRLTANAAALNAIRRKQLP